MAGQRLNMGGASAYIDHSDAVGSTTMETDPSGAVQWDVTHYPWGRVFQEQGTRQSEVVMGLDWQVNDPVIPSATREYNFRVYRWMTPDPFGGHLEDPQTLNKYVYAGNNPTSLNDPSGLDFYLSCQTSDHSGCTQVTINKSEVWVQADRNGKANIITSDSIRAGKNNATVSESGVVINGKNQGIYFDNPASIRNGVDTNPIDLIGSRDFRGISFHLDANCGGTCLSQATFSFPGDRSELIDLLKQRGSWNYGLSDKTFDVWFYHRHSTQFRFRVKGSSGPSPHFVVPNDPKTTVPFSGEFHVDRTANGAHLGCAVFKTGCL